MIHVYFWRGGTPHPLLLQCALLHQIMSELITAKIYSARLHPKDIMWEKQTNCASEDERCAGKAHKVLTSCQIRAFFSDAEAEETAPRLTLNWLTSLCLSVRRQKKKSIFFSSSFFFSCGCCATARLLARLLAAICHQLRFDMITANWGNYSKDTAKINCRGLPKHSCLDGEMVRLQVTFKKNKKNNLKIKACRVPAHDVNLVPLIVWMI